MQWFSGDIASAINLAKSKSAIFVVYCEGNDENSKQLTNLINDEVVSSKLQSESFVAIRIESDKPEYVQFCKIYQLVPVPSLFFIQNGIPIKIVTSALKTTNELLEAIDGVLKSQTETKAEDAKIAAASSAKTVSFAQEAKEPEIVCDGDKCYKKEPETEATTSQAESEDVSREKTEEETEEERQEKVKKALKLIEEQRVERVKEEQRLEKEREIRRRQEGQEIQKLRKWQDDQEMMKLQDERKREKLAAIEARKRVLQQIEEDKKERARRFNPQQEEQEKKPELTPPQATTPTIPPNSARIQFKKPDGESEIVTFDSDIPFADLHAFVKSDILSGTSIREFTLATAFPRREFSEADFEKTLIDLNLAPSAVVLIIPGKVSTPKGPGPSASANTVLPTQTGGGMFEMFGTLIMQMFTPVLAFFVYLKNLAFRSRSGGADEEGKRKRDEEAIAPNDAAKRRNMNRFNSPASDEPSTSAQQFGAIPKSGTYKRVNPSSNIHQLRNDSDTDDEERKTYNGNSTQQM